MPVYSTISTITPQEMIRRAEMLNAQGQYARAVGILLGWMDSLKEEREQQIEGRGDHVRGETALVR